MKYLLPISFFISFFASIFTSAFSQCANPTVMLLENFNSAPVTGAITANIYGTGFHTNPSYTLSGAGHGWFNVVNGLSNIDVYDRQVTGLCVGETVTTTFWTRHSFGTTNVTYSLVDDFGAVLNTTTLNLTTSYQQITFNAVATTPGVRFIIHCNSVGGGGVDICIEDLSITQCISTPSENQAYGVCTQLGAYDLFSLFSTAIPTGGTWSGPSQLANGDLGTFDPAVNSDGTYQYTVSTTCGFGVSNVVVETMPDVDLGNDTTLCAGATIQLDAGPGFDSYLWSNMATTQTIDVSNAGLYSVSVTSLLGGSISCTKTDDIQINVETPVQVVSSINPTCNGDSDGEIHVDNPLAVEYLFDGGIWQSDSFLLNVGAGMYSVCSRTALGCEVCENVMITDPALVVLSVSNDTTICENGTAQLLASATGGTTFDFYWGHTTDLNGNQDVSPSVNTSYTVYAENENGCQSPSQTIDVTLFDPLSGTISVFDTICPGFSSDLSATAAGGSGVSYTFSWSSGDVFTGIGTDQITVSPTVSTAYTLTISDGCESTPIVLNTNVHVAPLPVPSVNVLNPYQCEPAVFEIVNTTQNTLYNYWLVDGNQEFVNQNTITTSELYAGSYDLQLIVTSIDGCIDSTTFVDLLNVDPVPIANFNYSPNPVLMFNTQVNFTNLSFNGSTYEWFFEEGLPATSTDENPDVLFPDGLEGQYDVTLITTSDLGCKDTVTIPLIVLPEVLMYAPNAFTPDGDEHNQNWRIHIVGVDVFDFECLIFNRWGELVWENHDPEVGWDGTYGGGMCQSGIYTWVVRAKDSLNDGQYVYRGHVNLMK